MSLISIAYKIAYTHQKGGIGAASPLEFPSLPRSPALLLGTTVLPWEKKKKKSACLSSFAFVSRNDPFANADTCGDLSICTVVHKMIRRKGRREKEERKERKRREEEKRGYNSWCLRVPMDDNKDGRRKVSFKKYTSVVCNGSYLNGHHPCRWADAWPDPRIRWLTA